MGDMGSVATGTGRQDIAAEGKAVEQPDEFDRVFEDALTRDDRELLYVFRIAGGIDPITPIDAQAQQAPPPNSSTA